MSVQRIFAVLLFTTAACGGTDVSDFEYGGGQPGAALPEGGEIRHENVRFFGQPEQTWLLVYQYTGLGNDATAPFAVAADGGHGTFGNCVDERTGSPNWPFHPLTGASYLDLPKVEVSGPGITGVLTPPRTTNVGGNSTFRQYGVAYGGGAPNPMTGVTGGYNAGLTKEQSTPGAEYTLDIGKKDQNGMLTKMTYNMPGSYIAPLGIGGAGPVMIPKGKDLVLEWTPPKNDFGASGKDHTKKTFFNLTFFADPTSMNPPQFLCFNDSDGHTTVPAAVVDLLPAGGLMVNANLAHWMEAREANPGEMRRFDLVTIFCNISPFMKQ